MRIQTIFLIIITSIGYACQSSEINQEEKSTVYEFQSLDTFEVPSSVRALEVIDEQNIWFAGSEGVYGFTENGGQDWTLDSIRQDSITPHFRSIAFTKEAIFLLSIASPALLYRSEDQGENWEIVYQENHPAAFYDAMSFWDDQNGIAMGDPTEDCMSVIVTNDGGRSWKKVSCENLPTAAKGEAAFAASNSNLALRPGGKVWMVSGGNKARVFYSSNYGQNWKVADTPIKQGGQMTGIYSVDFFNDQQGIIFGGDWNEKNNNTGNIAITKNGGQTWELISEGTGPGYRSQVLYLPGTASQGILAVGSPGISISLDAGQSWKDLNTQGFYSAGIHAKKDGLWLAGAGKIGKITFNE